MSIHDKNFNVVIFLGTVDMTNVKLCMVVVLNERCPFIPLSVALIVFQGHGSVKHFELKIVCAYLSELKFCTVLHQVDHKCTIVCCGFFGGVAHVQGR